MKEVGSLVLAVIGLLISKEARQTYRTLKRQRKEEKERKKAEAKKAKAEREVANV